MRYDYYPIQSGCVFFFPCIAYHTCTSGYRCLLTPMRCMIACMNMCKCFCVGQPWHDQDETHHSKVHRSSTEGSMVLESLIPNKMMFLTDPKQEDASVLLRSTPPVGLFSPIHFVRVRVNQCCIEDNMLIIVNPCSLQNKTLLNH